MNYDVDSRVGKKSPDLSNHDDRVPYVEGQRLKSFIPGLSPMSVRVREDLAKYKAESEAKSEMLQMTKAFQEAIAMRCQQDHVGSIRKGEYASSVNVGCY